MCGFRSPETRAQFGSVDLRFPGCCSQSLGGLHSLVCVPGKALTFPHRGSSMPSAVVVILEVLFSGDARVYRLCR